LIKAAALRAVAPGRARVGRAAWRPIPPRRTGQAMRYCLGRTCCSHGRCAHGTIRPQSLRLPHRWRNRRSGRQVHRVDV